MSTDREGRACVVLPTYNGEQFVEQQIQSILDQTYEKIDILVRDDGSSDGTVDVVRNMARRNGPSKRVVLIEDDKGNLGFPDTFYQVIRSNPDYPFYFFCDQDDIWLPTKVETAVRALSEHADEACVYFSSFEYRYPDGTLIRQAPPQPEHVPFWRTLYYTPGLGFTIAFNALACQRFILECTTGTEMHDRWMLRCSAGMGRLICDQTVTAWHLRHEEAVTAADRRVLDLVSGFVRSELGGDDAIREKKRLAEFLEEFGGELSPRQQRVVRALTSDRRNPVAWAKKVFLPHRLRSTLGGEVALRLLFLIGKI